MVLRGVAGVRSAKRSRVKELVPKKTRPKAETTKSRSIWLADADWEDLKAEAKKEGYSVSKFAGFLLVNGLRLHREQRAQK